MITRTEIPKAQTIRTMGAMGIQNVRKRTMVKMGAETAIVIEIRTEDTRIKITHTMITIDIIVKNISDI